MGDGTSGNTQMEMQTWSEGSRGGQVCSEDCPLLDCRQRTCTLGTILAGCPLGQVAGGAGMAQW